MSDENDLIEEEDTSDHDVIQITPLLDKPIEKEDEVTHGNDDPICIDDIVREKVL